MSKQHHKCETVNWRMHLYLKKVAWNFFEESWRLQQLKMTSETLADLQLREYDITIQYIYMKLQCNISLPASWNP